MISEMSTNTKKDPAVAGSFVRGDLILTDKTSEVVCPHLSTNYPRGRSMHAAVVEFAFEG